MSCDFCAGPGRPRHRYSSTIIVWGNPNTRNGAVYRCGPGAAYLHPAGRCSSVDRAALEQRFLGDGRMLRRRMGTRDRVCRGDGLDVRRAAGEEPWATL